MSKRKVSSQSVRQSAKRRKEEARERRNSQIRATVIAVVGILLVVGAVYAITVLFLGDSSEAPVLDLGEPGPLAEIAPVERLNYYDQPPEMTIDPDKEYEAIIRTEKGDMRLRLFAAESPLTVNNFVFLAREGFYDGTIFHRVLQNFMAQGGDPTGTGTGGPGYRFADEVDNGLAFDRPGLLAMANSGANTNGSQFFITYVPRPDLNGRYSIFGELIEGQDVHDSLTKVDPENPTGITGDKIERIAIIER